jgi:hypothetical protein
MTINQDYMTSAPCRVKRVSEQFKRRKARNEAKELAVIQAAEREEEERVNKVGGYAVYG